MYVCILCSLCNSMEVAVYKATDNNKESCWTSHLNLLYTRNFILYHQLVWFLVLQLLTTVLCKPSSNLHPASSRLVYGEEHAHRHCPYHNLYLSSAILQGLDKFPLKWDFYYYVTGWYSGNSSSGRLHKFKYKLTVANKITLLKLFCFLNIKCWQVFSFLYNTQIIHEL